MDKAKRDRSANFSLHERDILVSLVKKYQTVLEKKQSGAATWKMKEAAWKSIQNEFNARSGGIFRSTKTLKVKYEGLKRTVRKKSTTIRSQLYRTEDGTNTAPSLDSAEEQIKAMISQSTDGMNSINDSDELPQTQENQANKKKDVTSRRNLKSRKHPALIGNVPKMTLFNDLFRAKLELVQLKKKFFEEEIQEKRKVWEFEENERKKEAKFKENERQKEAEFKEKERKWKEEEYKLKLLNNFK